MLSGYCDKCHDNDSCFETGACLWRDVINEFGDLIADEEFDKQFEEDTDLADDEAELIEDKFNEFINKK